MIKKILVSNLFPFKFNLWRYTLALARDLGQEGSSLSHKGHLKLVRFISSRVSAPRCKKKQTHLFMKSRGVVRAVRQSSELY